MKIILIVIGLIIIIHFILYYCNIDIFKFFNKNKTKDIEDIEDIEVIDESMINIKNNLEESLNELKQYNTI
jgi:hypothetical protein